MAKDLAVKFEDRPGTLADAAEALAGAGINIEGLVGGGGYGHVLVEDAASARAVIESAGGQVTGEQDVVVVQLEDRPGTLAEVARKIADAGVNIEFVYVATGTRAVFGTKDVAATRAALGL